VAMGVALTTFAALAACGRSGSSAPPPSSSGASSGGGATASASSGNQAGPGDFGDLKAICGPGTAKPGTGRGLTGSTIQLGTMADPGAAAAPGLGKEFFQVGDAFVKWCNAAGGINGRKITLTDYDAKLFNVNQQMIQACQKVFMLVGNGNAFDAPGVNTRVNCKLGQISGYVVSPEATSAGLQVQPTPNPANEFQYGPFRLMGLAYPQTKTSGVAVGSSNVASLTPQGLRTRDALEKEGFKVANYSERPPLVTNWRPYMEEIKNSKAGGYMNSTSNAGTMAPELSAIRDTGLKLDWMLLGNAYYEPETISAVKSTGTDQKIYQYFSHLPFELNDRPIVQEIKKIMEAGTSDPDYTDFTALGFSAWALWAKSATACGDNLTQDCVLQKAGSETAWTAGGLFPARNTDPKNPKQTRCFVIMDATPNGFVYDKAITRPNNDIYNCDEANVVPLTKTYLPGS
jgi:ABC-type branched-subunit amino acid transport system substrate-binding protein